MTKIKLINALSISFDFWQILEKKNLKLKVHSIYNRVLNVVDSEKRMFSFVLPELDNAPMTIRLDLTKSFKNFNFDQNNQIVVKDNEIILDNKYKVILNSNSLEVWQPDLKKISYLKKEKLTENIKYFDNYLLETEPQGGGQYFYLNNYLDIEYSKPTLMERTIANKIRENIITNSFKKGDISDLIGLGIGLTPSGDDFLTGYLFTMFLFKDDYAQKVYKLIKRELNNLEFSTTDVSRAMLNNLLKGKVRNKLIKFIRSLNKNKQNFVYQFNRLLTIGSSSGMDMAVGVITAYREILSKQEMEEEYVFQNNN